MASPEDFGRTASELEMRRMKLQAIEEGQLTDFSFLVGPDKDTAVVRVLNF